jgi:HAD superfamily hydrolase (TIGR01509 family)
MIKTILFDFNGVIIDDEPLQMKAYQEVLAKEDIALTEEQYYECLGMDDKTFIETAFARVDKKLDAAKTLEVTQAKTDRWRDLVSSEVPLFPGVENFIRKSAQEFDLGIVSMARREEIEYILERTNLTDCFSILVSAEDVTACKPDPQCYRAGFRLIDAVHTKKRHLPTTHGECLVIEDSPQGIMAARNADLKALGVTNTVSAEELREAGADAVTKNLDDWTPEAIRLVFV